MLFICTENTNSVPVDEIIMCKVNEGCFGFDSLLSFRTVNLLKSSDGKRGNSCETCSSATQIDPQRWYDTEEPSSWGGGLIEKLLCLCKPAHKWSGQYPVQRFATLLARNTVSTPRTGMGGLFSHCYNRLPSFGLSENLAQRKVKAVGLDMSYSPFHARLCLCLDV